MHKEKLGKKVIELLNSIYENFRQRLNSPLIGAFVLSWSIYNWKFVYYLLNAEEPVSDKINNLSITYFESSMGVAEFLGVPLILAFVYILGFPWVNLFIQYMQNKPNKKRVHEAAEYEIACLKSQKELAMLKAEREHFPEIARLNVEKQLQELKELEKRGVIDFDDIEDFDQSINITTDKFRSPMQIENFRENFELDSMRNDRIYDLITYLEDSINLSNLEGAYKTIGDVKEKFIGFVNFCDRWIDESKHKGYLIFDVIKRLINFQTNHGYPRDNSEWHNLLNEGYPDYDNFELMEIMDNAAKGKGNNDDFK